MPIRLLDTSTVQTWAPMDGVSISYRQAKSGDALRSIRRMADETTGKIDAVRADCAVVAMHVVGWTGFEDATGGPLTWPTKLEEQLAVLDALPWGLYARLRILITEQAQEATNSGKDSPRS